MNNIDLSIIVPVYNVENYLRRGLDIMYLEKIMNVRENIKDTVIKIPLLYSNVF